MFVPPEQPSVAMTIEFHFNICGDKRLSVKIPFADIYFHVPFMKCYRSPVATLYRFLTLF
jgi:hypothetical protein